MFSNKKTLESLFVILQITEKCNLACPYCYLSKKSRSNMPLSVVYQTLVFLKQLLRDKHYKRITICFHGGEPTLCFNLVKKIVKYAQKIGINTFVIGTNAINIDKEMIRFFISNNISPTISMDGISVAQDINRPYPNGQSSWKDVDKTLNLFGPNIYFWNNKEVPDPLRIRITFTPQTVKFLAASVNYLINKSIGNKAFITIMPAMFYDNRWISLIKKGNFSSILYNQMEKIADFFIKKGDFNLCINECLYSRLNNFLNNLSKNKSRKKANLLSCGAGTETLGISMDGRIYPCYLLAANPNSENSNRFFMGDVFNGITRPGVVSKFCGSGQNKKFSCLYWNRIENGDPNTPALIYSVLYQGWLKALKKVSKYQKW